MKTTPILSRFLVIILAAGLTPFCFPPFDAWPLMLVSIFLLLWAATGSTMRVAFYGGLLFGVISFGASLAWLSTIFGPGCITLFLMFGMFPAFFCMTIKTLRDRFPERPVMVMLLVAVSWTAIEFFRSEIFYLRFPWITPGTSLGPTFLSPLIGVYGTTFLIVLAVAGLLHRRTQTIGAVLCLCICLLGFWRPAPVQLSADDNDHFVVGLVQAEERSHLHYIKWTRSLASQKPDLVVWPEYSLPDDVEKDEWVYRALTNLCAEMDIVMVVGTRTVLGPGTRDWHNTAMVLNADGIVGRTHKARPIHFMNDGQPATHSVPVQTRLGAMANPVCFDCDYTEITRRFAAAESDFFAVPIMDAERWTAWQHVQHAALLRCRAAETGRWFASAASSGVSQIIDPTGHVHHEMGAMEEGAFAGRIAPREGRTVFVRVGWLFPWVNLAVFVLLAFWLVFGKGLPLSRRQT